MKKTIIITIIVLFAICLIGCNTESIEQKSLIVEYDKEIFYSQFGKIVVTSPYEDDEIYIESLNEKVIKINTSFSDTEIAEAVGEGIAQIYISNNYGEELYITITVKVSKEFAPPIEKMELSIVESGPYYVGETYHLHCDFYPSVFKDTYRFIKSDDYEINPDTMEIIFKHAGNIIVSIFAETNSKRTNLPVEVNINKEKEMYEILFIGNSLTYVCDIPSIIKNMIVADGVYINYIQCTEGGYKLIDHQQNFNKYMDKYQFSHVILQGQSYEPIINYDLFMGTIRTYKDKLEQEQANIIMYQTWAYNAEKYNGIQKYEMLDLLVQGYNDAASELSGDVAKSGQAFKLFEETFGLEPTLYSDLNHQSTYGAFLSACVLYSTITGRKSIDNNYSYPEIDMEWQLKIKQIADIISFN